MKKKIFSLVLAIFIMISSLSMTITATTLDSSTLESNTKISEDLKEKMNDYKNDEYIPIYIWLGSVGDDIVYKVLSKKVGTEVTAGTEDSYIETKIKEKLEVYSKLELEEVISNTSTYSLKENIDIENEITTFRQELSIPLSMTDAEIKTCIESKMPIEKILMVAERNQLLSDFRSSRKEVNEITNNTFEKELDKTKCKEIFVDPALPFVTMECKKSYIETIAQNYQVIEIGYYEEVEYFTDEVEESEISQTEQTSIEETTSSTADNPHIVSGNYLMTPHDTLGYTGAGVRVGVLETENYDSENVHLKDHPVPIIMKSGTSSGELNHATKVLNVLCGKAVVLNGVTYQGIAQRANIFFTYASNFSGNRIELDWLINSCNVSAINISKQFSNQKYTYNSSDQYLDCLVQQYRVVFVKSAGNYGDVTGPGLAYNVITVGNVSNSVDSTEKYIMVSGSGWAEYTYLTNKPDISAFGTNITMLQTGTSTWTGSGTSFSAPMVTGTVALMLEANPKLIGKPDAVKTILVQTAEENKISTSNNSTVDPSPTFNSSCVDYSLVKTEKAGTGLLSIKSAINGAISGRIISTSFDLLLAGIGDSYISDEYYFPVGTDIEIAMVFEKYTHTLLTSRPNTDLKLSIINSSGTEVFSSNTVLDNVEVFNITFNTAGYYRIKIKIEGLDSTVNDTIPTDLQTGHISHNKLNVSFMFACDCDNSNLRMALSSDSVVDSICDNCNQILCKESTEIYTYSEACYYGDASVLITHRVSVKNAYQLDSRRTIYWEVISPTFNTMGENVTYTYTQDFADYVSNGYIVVYNVIVYQNGVQVGVFTSDSLLVINADGNAVLLTESDYY